jgi:hypothetical protein
MLDSKIPASTVDLDELIGDPGQPESEDPRTSHYWWFVESVFSLVSNYPVTSYSKFILYGFPL